MTHEEILDKYNELCHTESDIWQHLPTLKTYADRCDHVTELGTRTCVSLYAFLASSAKKVIAIDILDVWTPEVDKLTFICADDLKIEIEQTDLLFVDTAHNYKQLKQELALHGSKVNKYLIFHDTFIFGTDGDDGAEGLNKAIDEFQLENPEWQQDFKSIINNGLTILRRI